MVLCEDRFMSALDRRVDPEVREVRRLEVITGTLGRRRWSAEAKARIVAESLAPGVMISEGARRHDLRPQQLFAWRQVLGAGVERQRPLQQPVVDPQRDQQCAP